MAGIHDNRDMNDEEVQHEELLKQARHDLAFNIFCGWLAYRLGVTLPTAKRQAEKAASQLGSMWLHVAEYVEKLHAGYIPIDLSQLRRAPEEGEPSSQLLQ